MDTSPTYYTRGNIEVWNFIRDQGLSYHLGCAIKYICRAGYKGNAYDDLAKAIHYLENELEHTPDTTRPSGSFPNSLFFANDWEEWETDPEMFDR